MVVGVASSVYEVERLQCVQKTSGAAATAMQVPAGCSGQGSDKGKMSSAKVAIKDVASKAIRIESRDHPMRSNNKLYEAQHRVIHNYV